MTKAPYLLLPFLCLLTLSVPLAPECQGAEEGKPDVPNILFCIADDWGWPHASAYDDPVVKTPNFDRVAKEGVLFEHAYISSPSCTPSRNAILTGQYHWRLGAGANLWSTLDVNIATYPNILAEKGGYHIGSWRKSWGPGKLDNWREAGKHPAGKVFSKGLPGFLDEQPEGSRFCFWLGASDPHRGYKLGSGKASGIDPSKIELFPHFPDSEMVRGDVADYYFEVQRFDGDIGKALALLEEKGALENTFVVITGDHGMPFPRCKSNLYDSGARVPLAIMWGDKVPKPGRVITDFVSTVDLAPTFLDLAGLPIPEDMSGRSLLPLLLGEDTGGQPGRDAVIFGKERHVPGQEAPNMGGYPSRAIRTHKFLYIRNYDPDRWPNGTPEWQKAAVKNAWYADTDNGPTKTYIVDNKDKDDAHRQAWEWSFGKRPKEELYDCEKDPGQLVNLADEPAYSETKKELAKRLDEQLKATGDPRADGGGSEFDSFPYLGGAPTFPGAKRK